MKIKGLIAIKDIFYQQLLNGATLAHASEVTINFTDHPNANFLSFLGGGGELVNFLLIGWLLSCRLPLNCNKLE